MSNQEQVPATYKLDNTGEILTFRFDIGKDEDKVDYVVNYVGLDGLQQPALLEAHFEDIKWTKRYNNYCLEVENYTRFNYEVDIRRKANPDYIPSDEERVAMPQFDHDAFVNAGKTYTELISEIFSKNIKSYTVNGTEVKVRKPEDIKDATVVAALSYFVLPKVIY